MRQLVHDTNYDPAELEAAGWPLRWQSDGWELEKSIDDRTVRQQYRVDDEKDDTAWLRYQHIVPAFEAWQIVTGLAQIGRGDEARRELERYAVPRLITDANPYNAREDSLRLNAQPNLSIHPQRQGVHWVGDLMVEANVEITSASGELFLDLVEGGRHFTCSIDLASGEARLSAEGMAGFEPKAKTPLVGPGKHRVAFANFDDQLLLWVDGDLVSFEGSTAYDVNEVFGDRREIMPQSSDEDAGDLAPAGIGARGAELAITRLRLWRDIYYIADSWNQHLQRMGSSISDYEVPADVSEMLATPARWNVFRTRRSVDFPLGEDQFFVMGDNSAESADARLWFGDSVRGGQPGGDYLERRLLIGKALCVYWPHSWNRIPGTPIPFPLFPNFADMRLVR
jgi:signal peptidase I